MAIPTLQSLADCASYAKTVEPYLDQLYRLPNDVVVATSAAFFAGADGRPAAGLAPLVQLYLDTNPLVSSFAFTLVLGAVVFVVSEINRNYSQVDRCWSVLPTVYFAHFDLWARMSGLPSQRLDAALFFCFVWSARLTYNYYRKGGYNVGSEDYRWAVVKKTMPPWLFHIFNLVFISYIQSLLLYAIIVPTYVLLLTSTIEGQLTTADMGFVAAELAVILFEWLADQQQWNYQTAKYKYRASAKVPAGFDQAALDRGFVAEGLWAYSRHPNFAAEQTVWLLFYQWSSYSSQVMYSWAGIGAGILVLLFQGSTYLTEQITASKYPEYANYQCRVGVFVPASIFAYKSPKPRAPKVIRTSELAQRQAEKEAKTTGVQTRRSTRKR